MANYSVIDSVLGNQQIAFNGLPDTTARMQPGIVLNAENTYWGSAELMYARAGGSIRQGGVCTVLPSSQTAGWRYDMTEVPNTALLGRSVFIAMTAMTVGQFGWFLMSGIAPVNCNASVAADTAWGIAAAGQGGAITAGKQIVNSRIIAAGSTTVAKTGVANSGSLQLQINGNEGWFCGIYLSGTGIAALTVVTDIDPSGTLVTLSVATTAAVNGTVTGTYNNATVFYNIAHLNRSFAQGQIT